MFLLSHESKLLEAEHVFGSKFKFKLDQNTSDSAICMVEIIEKLYFATDQTFWRSVLGTLVGGCARISLSKRAQLFDLEPTLKQDPKGRPHVGLLLW